MPTATSFAYYPALPFDQATQDDHILKVDITPSPGDPDYLWCTLSGKKNGDTPTAASIKADYELAVKLWWNLYGMTGLGYGYQDEGVGVVNINTTSFNIDAVTAGSVEVESGLTFLDATTSTSAIGEPIDRFNLRSANFYQVTSDSFPITSTAAYSDLGMWDFRILALYNGVTTNENNLLGYTISGEIYSVGYSEWGGNFGYTLSTIGGFQSNPDEYIGAGQNAGFNNKLDNATIIENVVGTDVYTPTAGCFDYAWGYTVIGDYNFISVVAAYTVDNNTPPDTITVSATTRTASMTYSGGGNVYETTARIDSLDFYTY